MNKISRPVYPIHEPSALIRQLVRPRQESRLLPHEHMPATTPTHGLPNRRNNNLFGLKVYFSDQIHSSGASPGFVVNGETEAGPAFEGGAYEPVIERKKNENLIVHLFIYLFLMIFYSL